MAANGNAEIYEHPELGKIAVMRSPRAKRFTITVRPDVPVRLTVPQRGSVAEGLKFLESKKEWVARTLAKHAVRPRPAHVSEPFHTRMHTLRMEQVAAGGISCTVREGVILVRYPERADAFSSNVQQAAKKGIEEAWRREAKEILPQRTAELAARHGLRHGKVSVRNTVSKWGSCSARNDISLSLHLMRLPDHLIDYIILHELCHTVHKNHGPAFHTMLDSLTGSRHRELQREIRAYATRW